jgi:hypothetical protein
MPVRVPSPRVKSNLADSSQRFPPQTWLKSSQTQKPTENSLPVDYTSWSSLEIEQDKRQKGASNAKSSSKQPSSSYYSVSHSAERAFEPSLTVSQRRRAQNRASQRAFRERKERHVKNLEQQLEDLHQRYEEVLHAYALQKEEIANLRAELQGHYVENGTLQVPHNSPLEFASTVRSQSFDAETDALQFPQTESFTIHSASMTPTSNFESQNGGSRASTSEERTPFGSLLPLTPAEPFDASNMFRPSNSYFSAEESSQCYGSTHPGEAQPQDFSSSDFSKEFALNPTSDIFEGWR